MNRPSPHAVSRSRDNGESHNPAFKTSRPQDRRSIVPSQVAIVMKPRRSTLHMIPYALCGEPKPNSDKSLVAPGPAATTYPLSFDLRHQAFGTRTHLVKDSASARRAGREAPGGCNDECTGWTLIQPMKSDVEVSTPAFAEV